MATIAISGATGYIGSRVAREAVARGHTVVCIGRRAISGFEHRPFDLRRPEAVDLAGVSALVHLAHDFAATGKQIKDVNVSGSLVPLKAGVAAGAYPILLSSLSAFEGCRSSYGQTKLQLEALWAAEGGTSLRAGVVFGHRAGGIFGALCRAVERLPAVPVPVPAGTPMYTSYDVVLAEALVDAAVGRTGSRWPRALAADPVSIGFLALLRHIATAIGRTPAFVRVPGGAVLWALKSAERVGLAVPFRSDSMLSIANPAPADQVARLPTLDKAFPPIADALWVGAGVIDPALTGTGGDAE